MCAIAGILDLPSDTKITEAMLSTMVRRGPDGDGVYFGEGCTLLHSRLAVIDPLGGAQPMELEDGAKRFVMVYNGELYNTPELRAELERLGHRFRETSDTEVLIHAFAQWGEGCLERLNGIFSFAVWIAQERRLFLARDRLGVKPLFYSLHGGGLLFASEIKTILAYPSVKAELDAFGAAQVMMIGPGRIPGMTHFRGIRELEPGRCAWFGDGRLSLRQYWSLRDREHREALPATVEQVRYLVTDAVRRQTVSDVPLGCFLSGGLDSSVISAICAGGTRDLPTFSLDYQDNDRYFRSGKFQPAQDREFIGIMESSLDIRTNWTVLTPEAVLDRLEDAVEARDLPGMADVDMSLLAFCGDIRRHVKVALSGECADEIFGGYPWYTDRAIRQVDGFPWAQNTAVRQGLLHPDHRQAVDGAGLVADLYQDTIRSCDILPGTDPTERRMKQMMVLNIRWFMQTLLDRKDRMSMYHGLEVRVPFCDHRIAEYLYGVPWEQKYDQGREKGLLRRAMEGIVPEAVLYRKKSPYPKTHHPLYEKLVRERLERLLERTDAPLFGLCDRAEVKRLLEETPQWPWYGQLMTQPQTFAFLLQIECWLEHYKISIL
ncbi:MAG: asparagine synthase (glutamine-hydrolyzing) [Oscillospiraceae bacterium]|nr:asparagine synthase (glutamine-hydrolyzing) [Oscillospiraceae bacterium]